MNAKDLPRYSSSLGRTLTHISFKVKYCHKVFLNTAIRNRCEQIFWQAVEDYGFDVQELGFDEDHCHMVVDLGMLTGLGITILWKEKEQIPTFN